MGNACVCESQPAAPRKKGRRHIKARKGKRMNEIASVGGVPPKATTGRIRRVASDPTIPRVKPARDTESSLLDVVETNPLGVNPASSVARTPTPQHGSVLDGLSIEFCTSPDRARLMSSETVSFPSVLRDVKDAFSDSEASRHNSLSHRSNGPKHHA